MRQNTPISLYILCLSLKEALLLFINVYNYIKHNVQVKCRESKKKKLWFDDEVCEDGFTMGLVSFRDIMQHLQLSSDIVPISESKRSTRQVDRRHYPQGYPTAPDEGMSRHEHT